MVKNKKKEDKVSKKATKPDEILDEEEYVNAVINGDILLPVYDQDKMIAKVQWKGNLESYTWEAGGMGVIQYGNQLILTELEDGEATTRIVTPKEAIHWIVSSEDYHLLNELNLHETLIDLVLN